MSTSMFVCYITLADGSQITGVINAASCADARSQIRNTEQGATARSIEIERTH
jgi:hypothetical protein